MSDLSEKAGFCHETPAPDVGGGPSDVDLDGDPRLLSAIVAALRRVYDPEIPLNIYDLGLVYRIAVDAEGDVVVDMTLTAPSCPVAGVMPLMVRNEIGGVGGVGLIAVNMVWDPPWSQERLSDEAMLELGLL